MPRDLGTVVIIPLVRFFYVPENCAVEKVARPVYRLDQCRRSRIGLNFFSDTGNERIDASFKRGWLLPRLASLELLARKDTMWRVQKPRQDVGFGSGEAFDAVGRSQLQGASVKVPAVECGFIASQSERYTLLVTGKTGDANLEFRDAEWLRQIVVRQDVAGSCLVVKIVFSADDECGALLTQTPCEQAAVGQTDIDVYDDNTSGILEKQPLGGADV